MDRDQFKILYREFLFRMVDRELLSAGAQGDSGKLLGRFAAILIWVSIGFTGMALGIRTKGPRDSILISAFAPEHILIATTMLVVGLFAVLSWDSIFPDRRDVLVLTPLPVSPGSIVMAKTASLAAALGISVALFNGMPGVFFPFSLSSASRNLLELIFSIQTYRTFAAYWITVLLAGAFILCCVVCVQAAAAQLPRALFLRLSSFLQIATFCLCVGTYFLQPSLTSPAILALPSNRHVLAYLPSYWFLGLFQQLNGFPGGPLRSTLAGLALRAWAGLAIAGSSAVAGFLFSSFRTLRKIAEEPDIVPTRRRRSLALPFGSPLDTAIVQFSIRTLIRSRQHRVLVAFYSGVGFAILILFLGTPFARQLAAAPGSAPWRVVNVSMIGDSFVVMFCWILGIRAAFSVPAELGANWVFQLAVCEETKKTLAASRKALYVIGVAPYYAAVAAAFLVAWPWRQAFGHLLVLALLAFTLAALCLGSFQKIPFTCSYLPGKSNLNVTFAMCLMLGLNITFWSANFERRALFDPGKYLVMIAGLAVAAGLAFWRMNSEASSASGGLRFEEEAPPEIVSLDLQRDTVATD